jgi:methyltransferase-like protein 6
MLFYACDFSPNAIKLLDSLGVCEKAFVKDLVADLEISEFPNSHIDFITMIFFLSAIHPLEQEQVIRKLALKLKPNGCILFRDYGAYDLAMLRFIKKKKGIIDLESMLFRRGDNTLACFFEMETLNPLMEKCGFKCVKHEYCTVQTKNLKREIVMRRVFLNAIYIKLE